MKPSKDDVSLGLSEIGAPPDVFVAAQGLNVVFKANVGRRRENDVATGRVVP